jgi:hypothetical protein
MPKGAWLALVLAVAAGPALAANARHPYSNVDRRVDAGNDTGDSRVEELNRMQLDQNYYGGRPPAAPYYAPPPYYAPQPYYPAPGYPPPSGYYPPPPYSYGR